MRIILGIIIGTVLGFGLGRLDPEAFNKVSEAAQIVTEEVQEVINE